MSIKNILKTAPLVRVIFDVFGVYTYGKKAGEVNPKAHARVTLYGEDFKACKGKIVKESGGAFYKVAEVTDLNPERTAAEIEMSKIVKEAASRRAKAAALSSALESFDADIVEA